MSDTTPGKTVCAGCHTTISFDEAQPLELIHHPVDDLILKAIPGIGPRDLISLSCRRCQQLFEIGLAPTDHSEHQSCPGQNPDCTWLERRLG